jgi:acyl-ACP thioesterase
MVEAGSVWILNRMRVDIYRMPRYRETLTVWTWHKGSVGFKAGRDFLVLCGDETVAAATSQWLYYDLNRNRITKIPRAVSQPYTSESDEALAAGAIEFTVDKRFDPHHTLTITTREGDYDLNGHVNNTAYLEYLDTLLKRTSSFSGRVSRLGIQYMKEIGRGVDTIQAAAARIDDGIKFRFFDHTVVYAAGFATIAGST